MRKRREFPHSLDLPVGSTFPRVEMAYKIPNFREESTRFLYPRLKFGQLEFGGSQPSRAGQILASRVRAAG